MGIIGLGMAGSMMIDYLGKFENIRLTAAADLNEDHLKAFAKRFQAETYKNVTELCRSPNVDAVYIATPNQYHCEHALTAAVHGKHIIVEKPISVTLDEADRMIEAAERYGIQLCVCHKRSADPPIRKMREIADSGKLGNLKMIHNWHYNDWLYRPRTMEELKGGGVVLRQGAHQFDMIRYIGGGLVKSVRADAGVWDETRIAEGSYTAFLEFENGMLATSIYNGYGHFMSLELTYNIGADGQLVDIGQYYQKRKQLDEKRKMGKETEVKQAAGFTGNKTERKEPEEQKRPPFFGLTVVSCDRGDIRQSPTGLYVYDKEGVTEIPLDLRFTGLEFIINEFYESVFFGRRLIHDGRWGKANLELCLAVLESSKKKQEVYLSHQVGI